MLFAILTISQSKCAHLKFSTGEAIVDKGKRMDRWKEHNFDLYTKTIEVSDAESALAAMEQLSVLHELDDFPTIFGLSKAIDQLTPVKAPGNMENPSDLIKQYKTGLLKYCYDILCCCWTEDELLQDVRDTKTYTL